MTSKGGLAIRFRLTALIVIAAFAIAAVRVDDASAAGNGVFSALDYGRVSGSMVTVSGTITAGSKTLKLSRPADFANLEMISVAGAGANSKPLSAQIVSGGGTTTLTLDVAAATSVSSALVQHDDGALITRAFVAAKNSQGVVYPTYNFYQEHPAEVLIPSGNYTVTTPINATEQSAIYVVCEGTLMGNSGGAVIDATGARATTWLNLAITIPSGMPAQDGTSGTPSSIGILFARTANGQPPFWNVLQNPSITLMRWRAANRGAGSVALYDTGEEFTTIIGGKLSADNAAVFTGSNILGISSTYDSGFTAGSTSREFIENSELDGGYGFPLILEGTFDDEIAATFGGGVNGGLPSDGQTYAVKVIGNVGSVNLQGSVALWPQAVYFDTSSTSLELTRSTIQLTMASPNGSPLVLGNAADINPVDSFNENHFQVTGPSGLLLKLNNSNFQSTPVGPITWVPGNGNTFMLHPLQTLDPFWTVSFTTNQLIHLLN